MTISETIAYLEEIKKREGDLEVVHVEFDELGVKAYDYEFHLIELEGDDGSRQRFAAFVDLEDFDIGPDDEDSEDPRPNHLTVVK